MAWSDSDYISVKLAPEFFSNQEEVETEDDDLFSLEYQLRHLPDELNSFENSLNDYENMLKNLDTQSESELDWGPLLVFLRLIRMCKIWDRSEDLREIHPV